MTGPRHGNGPGGPPPGWRAGLRWTVAAAVIVLAGLAIALTVRGGGNDGRGGPVARAGGTAVTTLRAWQASEQQYDAVGSVAYGSELVVTADTGVYAYNRADGRLLWTIRPPAAGSSGSAFCGAGQNAPTGQLPVAFGQLTDPAHHAVNCLWVGLVDLRSGKLRWTRQIVSPSQLSSTVVPAEGMLTEISGGTVMATYRSLAAGFSASTGRRLWLNQYDAGFRDLAAANGRFYTMFVVLVPFPGQVPMSLDGISPATGDITSRLHLSARLTDTGMPQSGAIVSTAPMTLLVSDDSDNQNASFLVLDPSMTHITRVIRAGAQASGSGGQQLLLASQLSGNAYSHPLVNAIVAGSTLVAVRSGPHQYGLTAVDLATGARLWSSAAPGVSMVAAVAVDGPTVLAVGSTASGDPALVRVSLATGTVLSSTPRPTGPDSIGQDLGLYHFIWSDGRAYGVDGDQTPYAADEPVVFTLAAK